ncbi:MAG TPA: hypothetical protein VH353_02435 [Caulobacteraceae bacterium]|nr:hypothetical protein [Caulobacteraceae bacterium]
MTSPPGWLSPRRLPFEFDLSGDRLGYVELSEDDYRTASFLDQRILPAHPVRWAPWEEAEQAAAPLARDCDFIFHTGHVGSTLLSRLLGRSPAVFSVREPAVLRELPGMEGGASPDARLGVVLTLLSRVWRPSQRSLVKATSFVSELAPRLLSLAPEGRAILMFAAPQVYIAGILAGEASRRELARTSGSRLERLRRRAEGTWTLERMSEGERAAMSWACEVMALDEAARSAPDRVQWMDFDRFLADPVPGVRDALLHLRSTAPEDLVQDIVCSPDFGRYSKAPEHAYDADLRREVIARGGALFAAEIERGLAWLNALGSNWPPFAGAARAAVAGSRR